MSASRELSKKAVQTALTATAPLARQGRAAATWTSARLQHLRGRIRGEMYRLSGDHPDPEVADDILADRIRTRLGPVTRKLDVPHVHVTVSDHIVRLHGDVATARDAYRIEETVLDTAGVRGIVSMLHEGLLRSDSRPSEGARHQHSPAFQRLVAAAHDAGCRQGSDRVAVRVVLSSLFEQLPAHARSHLVAHLPADVKHLTLPARRTGLALPFMGDTLETLAQAVRLLDSISAEAAHDVVVSVLRTFREVIPDEARDVEALLPLEFRDVWDAVPHAQSPS